MKTAKEAQKLPDLPACQLGAKALKKTIVTAEPHTGTWTPQLGLKSFVSMCSTTKSENPKKTSVSRFNTASFWDLMRAVDRWNCLKNRNRQRVSLRESPRFPCIIKLEIRLRKHNCFRNHTAAFLPRLAPAHNACIMIFPAHRWWKRPDWVRIKMAVTADSQSALSRTDERFCYESSLDCPQETLTKYRITSD